MVTKREEELQNLATALVQAVKSIFKEKGDIDFSKEPVIVKKTILEYNGRMRADGMEKFNNPTFVSFVNYYTTAKDMERHNAVGALIIYVEQKQVPGLLRMLKYPPIDDEDENAMKDGCGTLSNIIAGRFKSQILSLGYVELEMSPFSNYRNSAANGVPFCFKEYDKYEISFSIDNTKRLVVEITMGPIPRAK